MKRVASRFLAILMLWTLLPVLAEIVENAFHLVQEGHFAHQTADGDKHDPAGPEHGCSGVIHVCACSASSGFLTEEPARYVPVTAYSVIDPYYACPIPASPGSDLFHPPRV